VVVAVVVDVVVAVVFVPLKIFFVCAEIIATRWCGVMETSVSHFVVKE
jgi:hypothetical protein